MWTATLFWIRSRYSHTKRLRMAPGPQSPACMTFWSRKKEFIYLFWQIFYYAVSLSIAPRSKKFNLKPISARQIFFSNFLMKVHTEVHCGDTKRNPKFQVNTFILYQDMEILNCSVFFNSATWFFHQLFSNFNCWKLSIRQTQNRWNFCNIWIRLRVIRERRIFIFNSVLTLYGIFSTFFALKNLAKIV